MSLKDEIHDVFASENAVLDPDDAENLTAALFAQVPALDYNINPNGITVWTPDKAPEWAKKHAPEKTMHIAWIPITAGRVTALFGPGTAFGKGFQLQTVTLPGDVKGFLAYGTESE